MHYSFLTTGTLRRNASMVRLREFGAELARRRNISVSFVVDDTLENREDAEVLPHIEWAFVPRGTRHEFAERRRQIRGLAADYLHVLNPSPKAFLAVGGNKVPVVGDWDEWPMMRPYGFPRKQYEHFLDGWLRRRSKIHVVCSRFLQEEFRRRYGIEASYIPYAVYLQHYDDGPSPFSSPTVVYVGNLYPAYDHDLIFNAMCHLKEHSDIVLEVIGDGPDKSRWQRFIVDSNLPNVRLSGFLAGQRLWDHLRHASCLLFPIRNTVLNKARCPSKTFAYMQSRRPIIANRVGEVAECLENRGVYVEPTPEAFAAAIARGCAAGFGADIDYGVEVCTWAARTDSLLAAIGA